MSEGYRYRRLDKDDAAVLLVDHQSGLISLVQDYAPGEFKNNVLALAALAKYFKLPTILTTSFEDGPNGPMVPEIKEMFPDAPYIPRPGQINAWDNADFVKAIEATGRKQLIIAGVVTDVCVAFPALSALEAGYEVFAVNPNADQVEGARSYHDLRSIPGGVEAVVIATAPDKAEGTMRECAELGIKHVWMHRSYGQGSVSASAVSAITSALRARRPLRATCSPLPPSRSD